MIILAILFWIFLAVVVAVLVAGGIRIADDLQQLDADLETQRDDALTSV